MFLKSFSRPHDKKPSVVYNCIYWDLMQGFWVRWFTLVLWHCLNWCSVEWNRASNPFFPCHPFANLLSVGAFSTLTKIFLTFMFWPLLANLYWHLLLNASIFLSVFYNCNLTVRSEIRFIRKIFLTFRKFEILIALQSNHCYMKELYILLFSS